MKWYHSLFLSFFFVFFFSLAFPMINCFATSVPDIFNEGSGEHVSRFGEPNSPELIGKYVLVRNEEVWTGSKGNDERLTYIAYYFNDKTTELVYDSSTRIFKANEGGVCSRNVIIKNSYNSFEDKSQLDVFSEQTSSQFLVSFPSSNLGSSDKGRYVSLISTNLTIKDTSGKIITNGYDTLVPSDDNIKNFNFDVGKFYLIKPSGDMSAIDGESKQVTVEGYAKLKTTADYSMKLTNNLNELQESLTVDFNGEHIVYKGWAELFKYMRVTASDPKQKDGDYNIYNIKITGNLPIKLIKEGQNTLTIGFNWVDKWNFFGFPSSIDWVNASSSFNVKFYVDVNQDGIDDNTGEQIPPSVDTGNGDVVGEGLPDKPTTNSIKDWFTWLFDTIVYIIQLPFKCLFDVIKTFTDYCQSAISGLSNCFTLISGCFSFVPSPVKNAIWSVIVGGCLFGLFKIIFGR